MVWRLRSFLSPEKKLGKFSKYRNETQRGGKSIGAARIGEKVEKLKSETFAERVARSKCEPIKMQR